MVDGTIDGWESYEDALAAYPPEPLDRGVDGRLHALQLRHHRPAEGHPAPAAEVTVGRGLRPAPARSTATASAPTRSISRRRRSITPRRSAMCDQRAVLGRHGGDDGAVRRRGRCADRALPRHPQPVGADHVRPYAEAAATEARARLRPVEPPGRDPRRRALPGRGQAPDDRMVGADPLRILRRHRGHGLDLHRQRGLAGPSRLGRPRGAGRPAHLRRGRGTSCRSARPG
jgi:hypothetical protein